MGTDCSNEVFVDCPGDDPKCLGFCKFKVCANWTDAAPPSTLITDLVITFEGETDVPLVLHPDLLEEAVADCDWNFNFGTGFIEYTDANGNKHKLTRPDVMAEFGVVQGGLNAADRARLNAIIAQGHCKNWTEAERNWIIDNATPVSVNGWNLTWKCQNSEPRVGLSVSELTPTGNPQISGFVAEFEIDITCSCNGPPNEDVLKVKLSGP